MESIWDLHISISRRLLIWSGISIIAGITLILPGNSFWQGFGIQAVVWGAIDGMIALVGRQRASRKKSLTHAPDYLSKEARKLRRMLWINTGLDVLYIAGGVVLASVHGNILWRGHGWGIVLQGGFLFFFDLIHARTIKPATVPEST